MLQLFEGYLDKKDVADEARYDKVREGAIVFLGTLARHLDPSDSKVNSCWQVISDHLSKYMCQEPVSSTVRNVLLYLGAWQSTVELTRLLATCGQVLPACKQ